MASFIATNFVYASSDLKPLAIMQAEEILFGNASHYFKDFNRGVAGECQPLMSRLEKNVQDENDDASYSAHVVLGELYDRALCVPFDPSKAFYHFKTAADMGGPSYNVLVGWKYVNGHGVEKSVSKAHENFKIYFQRYAFSKATDKLDLILPILNDRYVPDELVAGIQWFKELKETEDGLINMALSMIDGTGEYVDGTNLIIDIKAAEDVLDGLERERAQKQLIILLCMKEKELLVKKELRTGIQDLVYQHDVVMCLQ